MKYNIEKMTHKELLINLSKKPCEFTIELLGRYLADTDYIMIFEYNHNGDIKHGLQLGGSDQRLEDWIYNVCGLVQNSQVYYCSGPYFKPIALIIDGDSVGCEIEIETTVSFK